MPPQATGFRYTPPSYLLRTREENRPWKGADHGEDDAAMLQEDRPVRRETHIDAHFQQRVQRKQSRYRDILKGEQEPDLFEQGSHQNDAGSTQDHPSTTSSSSNSNYSMDDSFDRTMRAEMEVLAVVRAESEGGLRDIHNDHATAAGVAREARKQRLSGLEPKPVIAAVEKDGKALQERSARTLRAHRLRSSLKQTLEEVDVQTKLELRRLAQAEQDRIARMEETERTAEEANQWSSIEEERRRLQLERDALEEAKREAAIFLARQLQQSQELGVMEEHERMLMQKEQHAKLLRQRRLSAARSRDSLDEILLDKEDALKKHGTFKRRNVKSLPANASFAESDFAFLEDLVSVIRDSGLLAGCVSKCFCGDDDSKLVVPSSENSTSTGNPSVDLAEEAKSAANHQNFAEQMQKVYAKYRE